MFIFCLYFFYNGGMELYSSLYGLFVYPVKQTTEISLHIMILLSCFFFFLFGLFGLFFVQYTTSIVRSVYQSTAM